MNQITLDRRIDQHLLSLLPSILESEDKMQAASSRCLVWLSRWLQSELTVVIIPIGSLEFSDPYPRISDMQLRQIILIASRMIVISSCNHVFLKLDLWTAHSFVLKDVMANQPDPCHYIYVAGSQLINLCRQVPCTLQDTFSLKDYSFLELKLCSSSHEQWRCFFLIWTSTSWWWP